ncbi:hypothetical protein GCM10007938_43220 [Vibrio zhanjiangensis]|uniref:Uncharacterized protein n=1 Tax=Vibrio zhanjiangensis TaxID=1046128 RepID=A0ABQ6F5L8_9VIBR|nr:hypothetical protein [Vibrio zhanjiangensis]GLT20537.1 hypothetical protein GCM10007938_43220 [Vibrio zhanjiangensis]
METFFSDDRTVYVSQFSKDGWWLGNKSEFVSKGTALGTEFTLNIYQPSEDGMISKYDQQTGEWSKEIRNRSFDKYWDDRGTEYLIGTPDGEYPTWAIIESPPVFDADTQTVLHKKETGWELYDIMLGKKYYDEWGTELVVSDLYFELPPKHTFVRFPDEVKPDHCLKLVDGEWCQIPDHREKMAYVKDRDDSELADYQVEELGEIPDTHTLIPYITHHSWDEETQNWLYDQERHRPIKSSEEVSWRNSELKKVIDRIDQHIKDQSAPEEYRTSPFTTEEIRQLWLDRKMLSDYPQTDGFPFTSRPRLSLITP